MIKYEDECVGCAPELGCTAPWCDRLSVERYYCDKCGAAADYVLDDGEELCEDCAATELDAQWNDLSLDEKADLLDVALKRLDG